MSLSKHGTTNCDDRPLQSQQMMQNVQYTRKLLNKHCFMENRTFIFRYATFLDPVLGSTASLRIAEVLTTNWTQFTFQIDSDFCFKGI